MTQKQILSALRDYAYDLGAVVSIRKILSGRYEGRVRLHGAREYYVTFTGSTFSLVHNFLHLHLERLEESQRAEGVKRAKLYAEELQRSLDLAQDILALVGCRIEIDAQDTVTMYSPKTGTHSLCMKLGVRPVSDLLAHVVGFAEMQTGARKSLDTVELDKR